MQRSIGPYLLMLTGVAGLLVGMALISACRSQTEVSSEARDELNAAQEHLRKGEFQDAHDALLAAMRVAPGAKEVFDTCMEFISKATTSDNDEATLLAQDLYQRAENMIPFLPRQQRRAARERLAEIRKQFFGNKGQPEPPDEPFAPAEQLLKAIDSVIDSVPPGDAARLLQDVEAELNAELRRAVSKGRQDYWFWKRWEEVKERYHKAQNEVLTRLYKRYRKNNIDPWMNDVEQIYKESQNADLAKVNRINENIYELQIQGQQISRELVAYVEANVADAKKVSEEVMAKLQKLSRMREWNYNRWTLDRIDKVEKSQAPPLESLKSLSEIDENRLAPYVLMRYNEAWKKFFDQCKTEDKVEATKYRILRDFGGSPQNKPGGQKEEKKP